MKRVFALILALISCITLLTACGDSGEKEPEGPADRLDAVLDRSNDAGKFTMRFFDHILYEDGSTTVRRKVGDSVLITFPDGKLMLVDTATPTAGPYVARYLGSMGIDYLDYLLISHNHADHTGGVAAVVSQVDVGQVFMTADTSDEYGGTYYGKMMEAFQNKNIPITHLWEGDKLEIGGVEITCYNPPKGYDFLAAPGGVEVRNNSSICLRFVYGESSFLMGGDIYSTGEANLVAKYGSELQSDVIKMNHHGYEACNTLTWVRAVQPKVAVATLLLDNMKDLAYSSVGSKNFFLFADGCVKVSSAGDGKYEVVTQFDRDTTQLNCENLPADGVYKVE